MISRVEALIDLNALAHNFLVIRSLCNADVAIMPMVKANAYGHNILNIVPHLTNADMLGVACLKEAISLREAGIQQPIMVMAGFLDEEELPLFSQFNLIAVVHHENQLKCLEITRHLQPISVWMKLDTGMHRLGFTSENFNAAYERLCQLDCIQKPFGLMTHLANADSDDPTLTDQQLAAFELLTGHLKHPKSILNSAGILQFNHAHHDLVRPGIMLYGISPISGKTAESFQLKPVMTLKSKLIAIKPIQRGACVGYGFTYQADHDLLLGIVAIGYGDGYPRHIKSGTPVMIAGIECPIIGAISMDMMAVDLTHAQSSAVGDPVMLWGPGLPIERIAAAAGTSVYELPCQLTSRVTYRAF